MLYQQNELFRKHVIERAELSVQQAQDWVEYFRSINDQQNAEQWMSTLKHRLKTVVQHTQNDFQDREYRIYHDC